MMITGERMQTVIRISITIKVIIDMIVRVMMTNEKAKQTFKVSSFLFIQDFMRCQ